MLQKMSSPCLRNFAVPVLYHFHCESRPKKPHLTQLFRPEELHITHAGEFTVTVKMV